MKSVSITIKGLVQGVYFRQQTKEIALQAGITGEIKNLSDGSVHILATGTATQLKEFIKWCNTGPETALVTAVNVEKIALRSFPTFKIVR